mgnify:CR=1 FL=1
MSEGNVGQEVYSDMDAVSGFLSAWQFKVASFRCTGSNENCIIVFCQNFAHTGNILIEMRVDTHAYDKSDFFIEYRFRQTEVWNLCAHHSACLGPFVVQMYFIAKWRKITGNCK